MLLQGSTRPPGPPGSDRFICCSLQGEMGDRCLPRGAQLSRETKKMKPFVEARGKSLALFCFSWNLSLAGGGVAFTTNKTWRAKQIIGWVCKPRASCWWWSTPPDTESGDRLYLMNGQGACSFPHPKSEAHGSFAFKVHKVEVVLGEGVEYIYSLHPHF